MKRSLRSHETTKDLTYVVTGVPKKGQGTTEKVPEEIWQETQTYRFKKFSEPKIR